MKTTDDMSMEDILASIRKYVSTTSEPSKYDKKIGTSLSKTTAKVLPFKAEDRHMEPIEEAEYNDDEFEEVSFNKKPIMFEKALSKIKECKKAASISSMADPATSTNLMTFIKQSFDEKIQKWIDGNLESMIEKRLEIILEKVANERINKLLEEDSSV